MITHHVIPVKAFLHPDDFVIPDKLSAAIRRSGIQDCVEPRSGSQYGSALFISASQIAGITA